MNAKYAVVSGAPTYSTRNYLNRNRRKIRNRFARMESRYGTLVKVLTESGTLKVYTSEQVVHSGNVKRDAERLAKREGGTFVQL